jgi:hypothetical protein
MNAMADSTGTVLFMYSSNLATILAASGSWWRASGSRREAETHERRAGIIVAIMLELHDLNEPVTPESLTR